MVDDDDDDNDTDAEFNDYANNTVKILHTNTDNASE